MENYRIANPFKQMIARQSNLLNLYISEGLEVAYPIDLDTKAGQKIIKDFVCRTLEELVEAYNELEFSNEFAGINQFKVARQHNENYNTEIADVNHFLLDILLYSGIDDATLDGLLYDYMYNMQGMISMYNEESVLSNLLKLGNFYNYQEGLIIRDTSFVIRNIDEVSEYPQLSGARLISPPLLDIHGKLLWQFVKYLQMAAHELKNNSHKKTTKGVNHVVYRERLLYALITWGRYLDFAGFTQVGIYAMYCIKNNKNYERLKNGY